MSVKVGQVWMSNDGRFERNYRYARRFEVLKVGKVFAHVAPLVQGMGVKRKIRLDRFRLTSTGYVPAVGYPL